jgi:hypothetical protein
MPFTDPLSESELYSHNEVQYSFRDATTSSETTVECTITNNADSELNFTDQAILASAQPPNSLNSLKTAAKETKSIDEEIINENVLIDPTQLDKKFSYKDCEINPKLDPRLKAELQQLLKDHKAAFATSKLDVGKFNEFSVQLEIDQPIVPEKQHQLSDKKLLYCGKTITELEKLGLLQECHTVSNLHLVPKYGSLRDLTKASTYLDQVKGIKNTQFRILQDLRRIKAATWNVKKTSPKLPEQIFQKLRGKIVRL